MIAEYFVVRHHNLYHKDAWISGGPLGLDVMSFFFVLSGFVTMWISYDEDLSTWDKRYGFVKKRVIRFVPVFVLNYLLCLPGHIVAIFTRQCWADALCPVLQLGALDSWAGCGVIFIVNGPSWFLSTMVWQWVFWVWLKDSVLHWLDDKSKAWGRIYAIAGFWTLFPLCMMKLDIYTISTFPIARLGEFLVGCCVACILLFHRDSTPPAWLRGRGFWIPVSCVIFLYNLQTLRHGMSFLCLGELAVHTRCELWPLAQADEEHGTTTPCLTILDKVVNKYALVWAGVIYGVARAELTGEDDHWTMRLLQSNVFQFFSHFSITLYLSHISVWLACEKVFGFLLGWDHKDWSDDTVLFCTYVGCYGLHMGMIHGADWARRRLDERARVGEQDAEVSENNSLIETKE